jgi:CheY-like chemotaxis protein
MKEIILLVFIFIFFIIIAIILKNKNKNKETYKDIVGERITQFPLRTTTVPNKTVKDENVNFVDNRSTVGGIISGQVKKQQKFEESLKKPMGWVETKSYEDDVRSVSVDKYIPDSSEDFLKDDSDTPPEVKVNKNKKNQPIILVVDDSVTVLKFVSNLLAKQNYEIITKDDGLAALDYLKMTHRFPDLIISDLEMPKMHGSELVASIKSEKKFQNIPIIIVSANPAPHINLLTDGLVNGMIQKPFDKKELMDQIKYFIK